MDVTFTNVLEGARQYFQGLPAATASVAGPAYSHTSDHHHQQQQSLQQQQQQQSRPNGSEQQQNHDKGHIPYWPPQQARERTPSEETPRPSPHSQSAYEQFNNYGGQEQHPQQTPQQQSQQTQQQYFQFPRPNSREAPSNINSQQQYQSHILPNPSYHQQPSSPQQPRVPSRHQELSATPPTSQTYHQLQTPSQMYHNLNQPRANVPYYPQQHKTPQQYPSVSHSYKIPTSQTYSTSQENLYYQKMYSSHSQHTVPSSSLYSTATKPAQVNTNTNGVGGVPTNQATSQQHRTTHNLPPIAALSSINYHSNRSGRETLRIANSRGRMPTSTAAQQVTNNTSTVVATQSTQRVGYSGEYKNYTQQAYAVNPTVTYSSAGPIQMQSSHQQYQYQTPSSKLPEQINSSSVNTSRNPPHPQVIKQKRESPLDLSVKTIRTPADSTLDDADDSRMSKYYHHQAARLPVQSTTYTTPTYDSYQNTYQRGVQQRSHALSASAPKVDFNPNFNLPANPTHSNTYRMEARTQPVQSAYNNKTQQQQQLQQQQHQRVVQYQQQRVVPTAPSAAHINSYVTAQPIKKTEGLPRIEFPTPGHGHKTSAMYPVPTQDMQRKRTADTAPSLIPNKVPKVDSWRQTIDQEIEQRFSSYQLQQERKQQQQQPPKTLVNGNNYPNQALTQQKDNTYQRYQFNHYYGNHNQTYIPSAMPTHHYNNYAYGAQVQNSTSVPNKNTSGADKRVINLLRNSLEIRGAKEAQKKLEQEQHVQQPSSDVAAPLQPKPGIVGRHNMSPFTAASLLERNSNTPPTYKFHIPRAIDSVRFDANDNTKIAMPNQKNQSDTNSIIQQNNGDLDGLAAFLAARIRTKAELKQVGPTQNVCTNNNATLQPSENTKSEVSPLSLSTNGSSSGSPPKLNRERVPFPPRRRLFSRNEEENAATIPPRDKSGLRSSSETSVFDFPDTDSEGEMPVLERQSLEDMRRDRKSTSNKTSTNTLNSEPRSGTITPVDDIFGNMCHDLAEQLKQGIGKKRGRRKKMVEPEVIARLKTVTKQKPLEIKTEKHSSDSDEPLIKCKTKVDAKRKILSSSDSDSEKDTKVTVKGEPKSTKNSDSVKKPPFGNGAGFHPGWEEELYKYKRSLRMPPSLIHVTRPQNSHRSSSLPDLDPYPHSPAPSSIPESDYTTKSTKKTEPYDTDQEDSNSSFNFTFQKNYDSEGSSSVKSTKDTSILDKLLERYGGHRRKKSKKKDEIKVIPKSENQLELLPTPTNDGGDKKVDFRKKTVENFKEAFISGVKTARNRLDNRGVKKRASIKEVFGEDRPASAPPTTFLEGDLKSVDEIKKEQDDGAFGAPNQDTKQVLKNKLLNKGRKCSNLLKVLVEKKIKSEYPDNLEEVIIKRDPDSKSETPSLDGEDSNMSSKKKMKFKYMRRKFSSGFDYIRKKKKQSKKDVTESDTSTKNKRRGFISRTNPESVQDIQREIKTWVLNKGIGETHLHRAARLGYTDITAFCLEKMGSNPSPKDNAGYTPLHEACSRGHLDIARLLLMYGANVSESAQGGIRPLHEAAENGFVEIVRLLLSYGADPVLATYSGLTPLSLAADEPTANLLQNHLADVKGEPAPPWNFAGPASCFDPKESGYDPLEDVPEPDPTPEESDEDIEFEISDTPLPNLYTLQGESHTDRWILLQDLSNMLKIKSRDALLKQISCQASTSGSSSPPHKSVLKELKMSDFLEQARCCQFLNGGEKINTRASKIALVKYTDKVKQLLNVENFLVTSR